jgi:hypothetical protein
VQELLPLVFTAPSSVRREPPVAMRESGFGASASGAGGMPHLPSSASSASASGAYAPPPMRTGSAGPPGAAGGVNADGSKKMWGYGNPNYRERTQHTVRHAQRECVCVCVCVCVLL